ncbi:50S ribosomal protein L21 [Candidatus Cyrtobacter comes]|uniref:Large ribosomal subunit protein bL21 n=1 Tax=Candidatus Cyrtobacter comes TaxID=675776 RepID=A0ABU5L8H2_9RICK|nr:50S ribosomal protein L21 [Candidatus Cyrtobacter comes]MDZ5762190.1 50S ribosomal protein L21 [Candidatus Cyrtobacter comes]
MAAVVEFGGKQYLVEVGDVIRTELIDLGSFDSGVIYSDALFSFLGDEKMGKAMVKLALLKTAKEEKIIVFKKNRRNNYRRKRGHRQNTMSLRVEEIVF